MPSDTVFHHRSKLKQQNKPFKSRHATKGQLKTKTKGKVDKVAASVKNKHKLSSSKADRRNQAKVLQQKKRHDLVTSSRLFSGAHGCPKIVAVVPLCPDVDANAVVKDLYASVGQEYVTETVSTLFVERFKQKVQFVAVRRHLLDILDAVKVADFVVFVVSAEEEVDGFGELCLTTIKAQGVPSTLSVVQHLEKIASKKQVDIRKSLTSYMEHHFPEDAKLFHTVVEAEALSALRFLTQQRPKPIVWRDRHAYMLGERVEFEANEAGEDMGTLQVTGYIRGNNLSANRLIHLPNHGDFQIKMIVSCPVAFDTRDNTMATDARILETPEPELQESLVTENEPDPMEGEQTWPTAEELREADERIEETVGQASSDAGTAAWIVDEDDDLEDEEEEEEDEDGDGDVAMGDAGDVMGEPVDWASMNLGHGAGSTEIEHDDDEEYEEVDVEEREIAYEEELDEDEENRQYNEYLDKQKKEREDLEFPDEVDTPQEVPARTRFQRYRGLKSFRTSAWDPYENLPIDYSRIFQFHNFKRTKRRVLNNLDETGVSPGTFVTVHLQNVPRAAYDEHSSKTTRPFVLFSLLPHEQKYSTLNFVVTRNAEYTEPVKSKDPMLLHCGFRRYVVQPMYSTNTRGGTNNVHKFERFLQPGRSAVATVYAPIQFGPAPVLMFKYDESGLAWDDVSAPPFIGHGSIIDLDPCRIVAKRIILTGHPFKVHKRGAVIRYMFWNPQDINYFKPVQLVTKLGRVGHIGESLGTHGYMKCIFDGPLKGQDTVCMYLYKRVFPKWTTRLYVEGGDARDSMKMDE
ncbi:hypothetical protein SpCBS45565_g00888 [Spizellomyces sp. 'palustris']|nr:hypothetical protein SpCBS45565_g00888 [Spizellomyces sp. 'palustris']